MFKRKIYSDLLNWKNTYKGKYACLVEGARRVGKSTIVEAFASNEYKSYIFVDFSKVSSGILDIFKDINNHDLFFSRLQIETGVELYDRDSCIIFDEVQLYPKARQAIKHLVEDGRYDYIETGSLLSIKKNVKGILLPSEEHKISMYPMDFEEFSWAVDESYDGVERIFNKQLTIGEGINKTLMKKFRLYMAVGGMPQAVLEYIESGNFEHVDEVKREIIRLYKDDLMKIDASGFTSAMYESIPAQLALGKKRFVLSRATGKRTTNRDKERFYELLNSKTVIPCYNVTNPTTVLSQTMDFDCFKLYLSDTGLFVTMLFNSSDKTHSDIYKRLLSNRLSLNAGYLYENAVAQSIQSRNRTPYYHTWQKQGSSHSYEIDFLLESNGKAIPVEVKSSISKNHASLDAFTKKYKRNIKQSYVISKRELSKPTDHLTVLPIYLTEAMLDSL